MGVLFVLQARLLFDFKGFTVKTHASYGGCICKLAKTYAENETLPENRTLLSYSAIYANPKDDHALAARCSLYHVPGVGYIAASVRPCLE